MHVHHVIGVPARIGHRLGRNACRLGADCADEYLGLGRRQRAGVFDDSVDQAVAELHQVVRLPVVARTRRQERIERLLPSGERLHPDVFAEHHPERAQRRDELHPHGGVICVEDGERDDLFPVDVGRQERERRRLSGNHPDVELVRHRLGEAGKLRDHVLRLVEREDDEPAQHIRPHWIELELEAGDDAEVSAAAAQSPEQVGILRIAGVYQPAVSRDDIRREEAVDGHAVLPAQPAETAAKRQAGHPRSRVYAQGRGKAMRLRGRVEVGQGAAGLDGRPAGNRVHPDALHQRKINHQAAIADGIASDVVPAAANRYEEAVLAGESHCGDDVFRRNTAGDHRGSAVNHGVPNLARLVVARVARQQQWSPQPCPQRVDRVRFQLDLATIQRFRLHVGLPVSVFSTSVFAVSRDERA